MWELLGVCGMDGWELIDISYRGLLESYLVVVPGQLDGYWLGERIKEILGSLPNSILGLENC